MKIDRDKINTYISSSILIGGLTLAIVGSIAYQGLLIELRTNHMEEYCPMCGIFGMQHQVDKINQMNIAQYAVYVQDEAGERIEILDEEKNKTLVKTITPKKFFFLK